MDIEKAKKQFELVKDTETFVITTITFQSLLEEVEDQTKWADTYFKELQEAKRKIDYYEAALNEIIKRSDSVIPYQIAKQALQKNECEKCKELNEKWGNEHYIAYCDECLDKRLSENK